MVTFLPDDPVSEEFRAAVSGQLADFLNERRHALAGIAEGLAPLVDLADTLTAGGKRLRPAFCVWGYLAATDAVADPPALIRAAASLDLLHVSALVHDDVMDGSDTRRGQPSAHRQFAAQHHRQQLRGNPDAFGHSAAILFGDLLLIWSAELFRRCGLPDAAVTAAQPLLEAMRTEVTAGQFLDIQAQSRHPLDARTSPEEVMAQVRQVVEYKTARYTVIRPLQIGAALAGAPQDLLDALARYGSAVGRAFQFRDDVLGVYGDSSLTGKPAGDDLREGKLTVLVAHAIARAPESEARLLAGLLGRPDLSADDVAAARAIITTSGAVAATEDEIATTLNEALAELAEAPVSPSAGQALRGLARMAAQRVS